MESVLRSAWQEAAKGASLLAITSQTMGRLTPKYLYMNEHGAAEPKA